MKKNLFQSFTWFLLILGCLQLNPVCAVDNELLFQKLQSIHQLSAAEIEAVKRIAIKSRVMGQGNPDITRHPVSSETCISELAKQNIHYQNPLFERICGEKYMAPLYDPSWQSAENVSACIDQFEFPNIPCEYPVVWVRTKEAAEICEAIGKRLCDAHEWEGACEGALTDPDYPFELSNRQPAEEQIRLFRKVHNQKYQGHKKWAYGSEYKTGICATSGEKSANCLGGEWKTCGSNTFPAGYFPNCRSKLDVYDQHGNAAEHMNLPLNENQMVSRGGQYGYTEMKGSWFIFDRYRAHDDWCRWRAPYWHGSMVLDPKSHHNYHLGFRCCKTIISVR